MTDKAVRLQVEAAFDVALRSYYKLVKAERSAELDDRPYKRWDGRGFDSQSLEAGRLMALVELCPDLSERLELQAIRKGAREDAAAEWRERVWSDFNPTAEAA